MGHNSTIEWTDHTFNPWWGCTKVSPGCAHCYAELWAKRYGHSLWGTENPRRTFGEKHWNEPLRWNRHAAQHGQRERVFCASMADVFEDHPSLEVERQKLWQLMQETPMLDWLLLTKRPENIQRFAPWQDNWLPNVWAMVSVENQEQAQRRIPLLLEVPAQIRGLSVEPLIGAVDLTQWLQDIHWVIVGGESGRQARQMNPEWVYQLRDQCVAAKVPFFFKQWGEWGPCLLETGEYTVRRVGKKAAGRIVEGRTWDQIPHREPHYFLDDDRYHIPCDAMVEIEQA